MSSPATDAVRNVNGPEKDEEKATASIEEARPLDSQQPEPETAGDAEAVDATKAATVPASSPEEHLVPEEASKTKEVPPEQKTKAQKNTSDKPKPVAVSTRSKPSSLTKSLSNGKLFSRKTNGDPSKRGTPVMRGEASNPSSASETLDLKKKKHKKRGRIWRFLHSCFTPSESHAIFDDFSAAASDSKKKRASANDVETSEKKNGDLTVDTAVANAAIAISAPIPSTPSKSHSAGATGVEVVVPPTPKHELLPLADTEGVTSGAVQAPGSTGLEVDDSEASITDDERHRPLDEEDDEERLIMNGGNGIPIGPDGKEAPLLPPLGPSHKGRKCLVLDLDETLVHSSFKLIPQADYVVPVEIEWQWHNVYVIKRPGVDAFLKRMGEIYEVVVFTASLSKYADPVLDKLDVHKVVSHRLFRESCYLHKGNYVKDLSQLGRPIGDTIILDNSPASYIFHPNNAVPVSSWFNDPHDTELTDMSPFLVDLAEVSDIRGVLDGGV